MFKDLPENGEWKLIGAYTGLENVHFNYHGDDTILVGTSKGNEAGAHWSIKYTITLNKDWHTKQATITDDTGNRLEINSSGKAQWTINGRSRPELDGCLDVDLECSAITNTIPIHRLALSPGEQGSSSAVYVRANGLLVERLDQSYVRLADYKDGSLRFDYTSPQFRYHDILHFSVDGLIREYPGIGIRIH